MNKYRAYNQHNAVVIDADRVEKDDYGFGFYVGRELVGHVPYGLLVKKVTDPA